MKYYFDYLTVNGFKVRYVEFHQTPPTKKLMFDPIDRLGLLEKAPKSKEKAPKSKEKVPKSKEKAPNKIGAESPNFLLSRQLLEEYFTTRGTFFFNSFYMWGKQKLNIIPGVKSQDAENRKRMPDMALPCSLNFSSKYVDEAKKYVDKHFPNNYGSTQNFNLPCTHKQAQQLLDYFIKNKLENFGPYQDYMTQKPTPLFHSLLSSSINIGLLQPAEIVKKVLRANAVCQSTEGFIRQLFWREYQRYCYLYAGLGSIKKNTFGSRKLGAEWYSARTGILPLDNCIKKAFETGYLHHIERLMIIGNYMVLSGIGAREGFRWFMEFSCDSYEWVMEQNVLDMVFFISRGKTMKRAYISSSNYILKMSDYKKGEWAIIWDKKYRDFVKKYKPILGYPYH